MIGLSLVLAIRQSVQHEFKYMKSAPVTSVSVAGTFNGWDKLATPMTLSSDGKTWRVRVSAPIGRMEYKFVLNGSDWVVDPTAPQESDGNGHTNSVIYVAPADFALPARIGDGIIAGSIITHNGGAGFVSYDNGKLQLKINTRASDVAKVTVKLGSGAKFPMRKAGVSGLFETFRADLPWDRKKAIDYRFLLEDGTKREWLGATGLSELPGVAFHLEPKKVKNFSVPAWAEKTVFYQIFPDRFDNGDKSNDPKDVVAWGSKPTYFNRYGGDVAGIEKHLDYIASLGVTGLYFTPVFKSPSNHRYDATDYKVIAPDFGTNAEFGRLTRELKARRIRTVMDFAFNHTALDFFAFKDLREKGAASAYKDWYWVDSYPVQVKENPNYRTYSTSYTMPKLNVMQPEVHRYLLGVADFWKSHAEMAGMRLDVANEVDMQLWRDLRTRLKTTAPDTWIVGEQWSDATPWLQGDQWDSVMGYQFRMASLGFFVAENASASQYLGQLMGTYNSYAPPVGRNLMNLLSSHDTARFLTLCKGNADLHRLAATVQLTWPGTPSIYYGEEIGMDGGPDPDNRRCMEWSMATKDNPMLKFYRSLIQARNVHPALQSGEPEILFTNDADRTFGFARSYGKDSVVVAVNRDLSSHRVQITLPSALKGHPLKDVLTGKSYPAAGATLTLELGGLRSVVLTK